MRRPSYSAEELVRPHVQQHAPEPYVPRSVLAVRLVAVALAAFWVGIGVSCVQMMAGGV